MQDPTNPSAAYPDQVGARSMLQCPVHQLVIALETLERRFHPGIRGMILPDLVSMGDTSYIQVRARTIAATPDADIERQILRYSRRTLASTCTSISICAGALIRPSINMHA
jgi:hypothetical protein